MLYLTIVMSVAIMYYILMCQVCYNVRASDVEILKIMQVFCAK